MIHQQRQSWPFLFLLHFLIFRILYIGFGDLFSSNTWYSKSELFLNETAPAGIYSNDCNFVIGDKWEIDGIRTYTLDFADNFRSLSCIQSRETAGNTETYVPVPIVQFKCNYADANNTNTQIYDSKASHLVGTFSDSNNVKWTPWNWFWMDINVLRRE